ncbi:MAG: NACHT domain-containing protein [Verrucomicrobiaceae bacterium]
MFENIQARRADRWTVVAANTAALQPEMVDVWLDGVRVDGGGFDKVERRLSASLFGSLPPMLNHDQRVMAGYLPSTGAVCEGREDYLASMDNHYESAENRVLVLLGGAGAGKTTLAREWLVRRWMADRLQQKKVFSWSFYRQGYGAGGGQLLADFYQHLAELLEVVIVDTMLPVEVIEVLTTALREKPVLFFLDGLEVMQDVRCSHLGGVRDAALAGLLSALGSDESCDGSFALVTTRVAMREELHWCFPDVQHVKVRSLSSPSGPVGENGPSTLEWVLAGGTTPEAEALLKSLDGQDGEAEKDHLPTLVRRLLASLADSPEWAMLLMVGFFDRPPSWLDLLWLLSSKPPIAKLTETWSEVDELGWERAAERLQAMRLLHVDADCRVTVHPCVVEELASELKRSLPTTWVEGHRRLCAYFADLPESYTPDTILEMEPLFRAAWHGCQAGDYKEVFDTILFPRVARGTSGYPIFELGAYETGLHLARLVTQDFDSFPVGSGMAQDDQVMLVHLAALCMRYQDRLEEAYVVQKRAWDRVDRSSSLACVAPVAMHTLRCHEMFGNLRSCGPIMKKVGRHLLNISPSAAGLQVPKSFLAIALGFIGTSFASALLAKGHRLAARAVMALAAARSLKLDGRGRKLVPGMGCPWHGLFLLNLGDWQTVDAAVQQGDLADCFKRSRETGMPQLVTGRMLSSKALATGDRGTEKEALGVLKEGLALVQRNGFRWWQCAFHLAVARHYAVFGAAEEADEAAAACEKLARESGFKLMIVDAVLLRCKLTGDRPGDEIRRLIDECGYGAAR